MTSTPNIDPLSRSEAQLAADALFLMGIVLDEFVPTVRPTYATFKVRKGHGDIR